VDYTAIATANGALGLKVTTPARSAARAAAQDHDRDHPVPDKIEQLKS
jgi:hypothetical protein